MTTETIEAGSTTHEMFLKLQEAWSGHGESYWSGDEVTLYLRDKAFRFKLTEVRASDTD